MGQCRKLPDNLLPSSTSTILSLSSPQISQDLTGTSQSIRFVYHIGQMSSSGSYKRWLETATMRDWARSAGSPLRQPPPGLHTPERADLQRGITTLLEEVETKLALEMPPKDWDEQEILELMVAKLAATIAPIRVIPLEVLQHILSFLHFQIPRDKHKISNLMRVCHLWKHAVLIVPSVWNTIAIDHSTGSWNSDRLGTWLSRSANLPLHISVDLGYLPATCIPVITRVADRWTSFKLTSKGTGPSELMFVSALGRASRLKELHLSLIHLLTRRDTQSQTLSMAIKSNSYSTVSHANFLGITRPQATMPLLTHLTIDYCVFGICDLWELSRSSPLLEELELSRVSCACVACDQVMAANCTFPNLRRMVYIGHGRNICKYLLSESRYTATVESLELDIRALHSSLWEAFSGLRRLHLFVEAEGSLFTSLFPTYIFSPSWWLSVPCLEEISLDGVTRAVSTIGSEQSLVIQIITRLVRTLFEVHSGPTSQLKHLRKLSIASTTHENFFHIVSAIEQWARHYTRSSAGLRTREDTQRAQERLTVMQHPLVASMKVYISSRLRAEAQLNLLETTPTEITNFLSIFSSIS